MAGAILEKYAKVRFDKYIQDSILKHLDLEGGYDVDELGQSKLVKIYHYNRDSDELKPSPDAYRSLEEAKKDYQIGYSAPIFSPTGGMKISAEDLAKYMMVHMNYGKYSNGRLLDEKTSKIMQTPIIKTSEKASYGLALFIANNLIEGEKMVGHTGSAYGLYSAMFFEPNKKFGFVVITNGSKVQKGNGEYNSLLKPIVNLLYNEFIEE